MFHLTDIYILIIVFLVSFFVTYIYKNWAIKRSILDTPNKRTSHKKAVPRGGGIAIVIVFYAGLLFLFYKGEVENKLFLALLPGILLAIIGFIDDFKTLSPAIRFALQFVCAGISLYMLGGFQLGSHESLYWVWSLLAFFGLVWFINLFNFLDGSDGYASMEAITMSLAMFYFTQSKLLLLLSFTVCGFLCWNWPKAKLFMGDAGSTVLGFILAVLGIYFNNNNTMDIGIWILLAMLFWFDASVTLVRRILNREKLSQGHNKHMVHRFILSGYSHLLTLLAGIVINIVLMAISFMIWKTYIPFLTGFTIALVILTFVMLYVDYIFAFNKE